MSKLRALMLFLALFGFWQALSGKTEPLFVTMGLVSAAALTPVSLHLLHTVLGRVEDARPVNPLALVSYLLWLLTRIPPAGASVAMTVLDPRRTARPGVVRFRTGLRSPAARTLLANSITLVPGTMTINVEDDRFTVHAFTPAAMADLANAATQRRIARIFGYPPDDPPKLEWLAAHDELPTGDA